MLEGGLGIGGWVFKGGCGLGVGGWGTVGFQGLIVPQIQFFQVGQSLQGIADALDLSFMKGIVLEHN